MLKTKQIEIPPTLRTDTPTNTGAAISSIDPLTNSISMGLKPISVGSDLSPGVKKRFLEIAELVYKKMSSESFDNYAKDILGTTQSQEMQEALAMATCASLLRSKDGIIQILESANEDRKFSVGTKAFGALMGLSVGLLICAKVVDPALWKIAHDLQNWAIPNWPYVATMVATTFGFYKAAGPIDRMLKGLMFNGSNSEIALKIGAAVLKGVNPPSVSALRKNPELSEKLVAVASGIADELENTAVQKIGSLLNSSTFPDLETITRLRDEWDAIAYMSEKGVIDSEKVNSFLFLTYGDDWKKLVAGKGLDNQDLPEILCYVISDVHKSKAGELYGYLHTEIDKVINQLSESTSDITIGNLKMPSHDSPVHEIHFALCEIIKSCVRTYSSNEMRIEALKDVLKTIDYFNRAVKEVEAIKI